MAALTRRENLLRPCARLQLHALRGHIVLDVMFFEKRDDLGNIRSNADVQKLMLCYLFPVVRKFSLEAELLLVQGLDCVV